MATHKSAVKRHRQSKERQKRNKSSKSRMKTAVKSLLGKIETREKEQIQKTLSQTTAIISKTASKGIIKKNTAARKISRLAKKVNAVVQADA